MPITAGVPTESYVLDTYRNAYGTLVMVSNGLSGGSEVFHIIAGVGNIDGPNRSASVTERLTHSTSSRFKGKDPGMIDAGTLKFPVAFDPSNVSHSDVTTSGYYGLGALFNTQVKREFILATPKTAGGYEQRKFRGFVSELGESYPVEGRMDRSCTITIDGPVTSIADNDLA